MSQTKYIFVTGGVTSSLGKGIIAASLAKLLQARGYKTTIEGLSHKFDPEFWNYAKLFSSTLRHGMPIDKIVDLINSLQLDSESINTWKNGIARPRYS